MDDWEKAAANFKKAADTFDNLGDVMLSAAANAAVIGILLADLIIIVWWLV